MAVFSLVILGFVQGICEFLPISSSGHLVLFSKIFGLQDSLFVSIILHRATLLSVVVVMRKEVFYLIRHPFSKESIKLVICTICTCIVAIIFMPFITSAFEGKSLPIFFLLSSIILFFVGRKNKNHQGEITYKNALVIGLAQGLAIFPGLSRSGTTISAGLASGAGKEESAKFSFLASLPIIVGSLILEIYKIAVRGESVAVSPIGLTLAFLVSFVVGILCIKFMLKLTNNTSFKYFSIYLIFIAILAAIFLW